MPIICPILTLFHLSTLLMVSPLLCTVPFWAVASWSIQNSHSSMSLDCIQENCHRLATFVQAWWAEWSLSVLMFLGREVIDFILWTVMSIHLFVRLPFMAATSHAAFEKLNIHFWVMEEKAWIMLMLNLILQAAYFALFLDKFNLRRPILPHHFTMGRISSSETNSSEWNLECNTINLFKVHKIV